MEGFKTNKIILNRISDKQYNITIKVNNGQATNLQNRTTYDPVKKQLFINLIGLPKTSSYQVSHAIDFATYDPNIYTTLSVIVIEQDTSISRIVYELCKLLINDTDYPPPYTAPYATQRISLDTKYFLAESPQSLATPFTTFSNSFSLERISFQDDGNGNYDTDIEVSYDNTAPPFYAEKSSSIPPDVYRGSLIYSIVLEVEQIQNASSSNRLTFQSVKVPKLEFSDGISIVLTDKPLTSAADWKLIDMNKAIFYA